MITYKAALVGIKVEFDEESHTNKARFLDLDEILMYHPYDEEKQDFSGKRIGPRQCLSSLRCGEREMYKQWT
jgi:hypothetical protein